MKSRFTTTRRSSDGAPLTKPRPRHALVVTAVASMLGLLGAVGTTAANAAQNFDQTRAADIGVSENGTVRPTGWDQPGECVKSMQRWIQGAGGRTAGGSPYSSYVNSPADLVATGTDAVIAKANKGDVIQYTYNPNRDAWANGVHTVMVVANNGNGTLKIVQSNVPAGSGRVTVVDGWRPSPPANFTPYLWRFGQVPAGGGYQVAFQANTGQLWSVGSVGDRNWGLGMATGTSPSIAAIPGGYQIAFQANTGDLWTTGSAGTRNWGKGMKAGTSPSIVAVNGGQQVAFQANTGDLWTVGSLGDRNWGLGMKAGTSPTIAAVGGGYQVAFQANTGHLWTVGSVGDRNWGLGMATGTSPSIAGL